MAGRSRRDWPTCCAGSSRRASAKLFPPLYEAPPQDKPPARVEGLRVVHLGHASFLYQVAGLNILVDPVFSERASPFSFFGPKRVNAPGVAFTDLPTIDVVLVTHNHYDHLDVETLALVHARDNPRMIMPLGNDVIVKAREASMRAEALVASIHVLNTAVMLALVASIHVSNTASGEGRRGWSGQARP
jgi:hypothetical protein